MAKRKRKMVDGVLCRDSSGLILFFYYAAREDMYLDCGGHWCANWGSRKTSWWLREWQAEYDMPAPRRGRAFEVRIEL